MIIPVVTIQQGLRDIELMRKLIKGVTDAFSTAERFIVFVPGAKLSRQFTRPSEINTASRS